MDREIGHVLNQLRTMNAFDNTLIFFASDNGASAEQIIRGDLHDPAAPLGSAKSYLGLGPGWSTAANTPFRKHKHWTHEGGISTPLIAHWPAGIKSHGEWRRSPGHLIDIVPTLLELAGLTSPGSFNGEPRPAFPGRSLVASFANDEPVAHEPLFFSTKGTVHCVAATGRSSRPARMRRGSFTICRRIVPRGTTSPTNIPKL